MNAQLINRCPSAVLADETNGLSNAEAYHNRMHTSVDMTLRQLADARGHITRLRILSDRGSRYADISYCHGELPDGTPVRVYNVPSGLNYYRLKNGLLEWAKGEGVFAKGVGLLDEGNWSVLR